MKKLIYLILLTILVICCTACVEDDSIQEKSGTTVKITSQHKDTVIFKYLELTSGDCQSFFLHLETLDGRKVKIVTRMVAYNFGDTLLLEDQTLKILK